MDPGATLGTGEPVVQLISDARLVRFAVPEGRTAALRIGAAVVVTFEDEGIEVRGEVITIAPEIEAGTRLVFAEARVQLESGLVGSPVDDAEGAPMAAGAKQPLRVGAVARVRFTGGTG